MVGKIVGDLIKEKKQEGGLSASNAGAKQIVCTGVGQKNALPQAKFPKTKGKVSFAQEVFAGTKGPTGGGTHLC